MNAWIPIVVAILAGAFALYSGLQARGTELTTRYYTDLYDRVKRLEDENNDLREKYFKLREDYIKLLEERGIRGANPPD